MFDKMIELVKIDSKLNAADLLIKVIFFENSRQHDAVMIMHNKGEVC